MKNISYDLLVVNDKEWQKTQSFKEEKEAIEYTTQILPKDTIKAVKIVEKLTFDDNQNKERTIYENNFALNQNKYLLLDNLELSKICGSVEDVFKKDAKFFITKILQNYLNDYQITVTEILFLNSRLKQVLHNEAFVKQGVEDLAKIYSKSVNVPQEKVEWKLNSIIENLSLFQEKFAKFKSYYEVMLKNGFSKAIESIRRDLSLEMQDFAIYYLLVQHISFANDWTSKIKLLLELLTPDILDNNVLYLDEMLAEIFENDEACFEIIAKKDKFTFLLTLINLYKGTYVPQEKDAPHLADLNALIASKEPVFLKKILLSKINQAIIKNQHLADDNKDSEFDYLSLVIKNMIHLDRIIGKDAIAYSLTHRVNVLNFSNSTSFENAVRTILNLLPSDVAKIFYLLDLTETAVYDNHSELIGGNIQKIAEKWQSIDDMLSDDLLKINAVRALMNLINEMPNSKLPNHKKQNLVNHFEKILNAKPAQPKSVEAKISNHKKSSSFKRITFKDKEVIFNDGEVGVEAYLIVYGNVEIFKNNKRIAILQRGDIFGEMAIIDDKPRMASARAIGKTELTVIPDLEFKNRLNKLENNDPVIRRLIDVLVGRIRAFAQPTKK